MKTKCRKLILLLIMLFAVGLPLYVFAQIVIHHGYYSPYSTPYYNPYYNYGVPNYNYAVPTWAYPATRHVVIHHYHWLYGSSPTYPTSTPNYDYYGNAC